MLRSASAALVLLAASCAPIEYGGDYPHDGGANLSRIGLQAPPDTCGASRFFPLLGRPAGEAPPPGSMPNYRLAPVDAVLTADLRPDRLNIFFDRDGRIVGIRCF